MKQFVEQLTEIKKYIFEKMNVNKPMDELTNEQKLEFKLSSHCSICGKKFEPDDEKVRDHCHFTGKYRGAAHVKCNGVVRQLIPSEKWVILRVQLFAAKGGW